MGERTSHPPGALSWADLAATDAEAAKRFYGDLLGWEFEDIPMGDQGVYSMARIGGRHVAALSGAPDQPPHWNVYVTVSSADEAASRAGELGATILAPPFEVFDAGRMAVIQDPTGAVLSAWEPRANPGAELVNAPGALTWADVVTPDPDTAARFYGEWLGWTFEAIPQAEGYQVIRNGDRSNGGMQPLRPDVMGADVPPHWLPYFGIADLERAQARTGEMGGRSLLGPVPVPSGAFAILADPQGAVFALSAGTYDD